MQRITFFYRGRVTTVQTNNQRHWVQVWDKMNNLYTVNVVNAGEAAAKSQINQYIHYITKK